MRINFLNLAVAILLGLTGAHAQTEYPKGLMLNLDFEQAKDGLIPSKTLFPLFVPQGDLSIDRINYRNLLTFQENQGLNIPNSYLLTPDGSEWVVTLRAFVLTDGIILSQENDEHGLVIYIKDSAVQAVLRTSHVALTLKENPRLGISNYKNQWVTIELRISQDRAFLLLNRKRVAMVNLDAPLKGENMNIRLGTHSKLPRVMKYKSDMGSVGFTGAISSLKIHRN
jgi:hypothetical protein